MSRKIFEIFKCWLNITRSEMLTDFRYSNRKPNNLKCLIHNARVVNPHGQNKMHINDAYEILRSSSVRNEQICEDIRKCISEGRTPVVLSKFVEHAELIYDNIKNYADKVFLLTGSQTRKQQKMIRQEMNSISNDESMILVATGQLVGEGFDFPRLDTLIMATPVAWKGLVEQYAGRLNRDYE